MNRKKRSAHSWRRQTECWKSTMSALMMHGASSRRNISATMQSLRKGSRQIIRLRIPITMKYICQMCPSSLSSKFAESLDGVRSVNRSDVVARTLTSVNRLVGYVSIAIIAILLAVSIFLISNTVTMGITVRREEIAIMKYIGAKDSFVRAPFVIEGLLIGVVGAVIPLVLLYFMYDKAVAYIMTRFSLLNNIIDFLPVMQVYKTLLPVGIALGVGIGFVGSFFTIRKHLKSIIAQKEKMI
mgnify:CR=1 FL=1